jgi:hypothetical protein
MANYIRLARKPKMLQLPIDMIKIISNCLTLQDLHQMEQVDKDFCLPKHKTKKRISWCAQRITVRQKYRDGKCSDIACSRQRTRCIQLQPLERIILSNYCSIHTKLYTNTNIFNL